MLFCLPALVFFTVFFAVPVFSGFYYSLFNWTGFSDVKMEDFIGFQNYIDIFKNSVTLGAFTNTIIYAVLVTALQNIAGLSLALALDNKLMGRGVLRSLFFIPNLLSPVVIGFSWSMILDPRNGTLNYILRGIGLDALAQNWLGNPSIALYSVIFVAAWAASGYYMIIYLAGLQGVPIELYEASTIDGANWGQRFRYITFPLIAPSFTISMLVSMIGALKVFDIIYIMTNGGPGFATEVISTEIYKNAFGANKSGYSTAISVVLFIAILFISLIELKVLKKREDVY